MLGLVRGGVPVAARVSAAPRPAAGRARRPQARACRGRPEVAFGAIGGRRGRPQPGGRGAASPATEVAAVIATEAAELDRRLRNYRLRRIALRAASRRRPGRALRDHRRRRPGHRRDSPGGGRGCPANRRGQGGGGRTGRRAGLLLRRAGRRGGLPPRRPGLRRGRRRVLRPFHRPPTPRSALRWADNVRCHPARQLSSG